MRHLDELCRLIEASGDKQNKLEFYLDLKREFYKHPELFPLREIAELESLILNDLKGRKTCRPS